MKDIELKIETVRTSDLVPYAGNAKEHPAEQVEQIAASIREFGNCDPIAVWTNEEGRPQPRGPRVPGLRTHVRRDVPQPVEVPTVHRR